MPAAQTIGLLKLIALILFFGYLGLVLFAWLFANKLVFPAPPASYQDSPNLIKFVFNERGDSVTLLHLHNPASDFLVFYHHGNGEDLQSALPRLEALRRSGLSVLAWDYPGYGTSSGKPSEALILDIAGKIWTRIPEDFGLPHRRVLLYGRSIGGGPAVALASKNEAAGLILEATFTSIFRVVLGIRILPWDIFDNLSLIGSLQCPVLFLHGTDDRTVPFRHSQILLEKAPNPKFFAWFSGGQHNNLLETYPDTYYSSLHKFMEFIRSRNF